MEKHLHQNFGAQGLKGLQRPRTGPAVSHLSGAENSVAGAEAKVWLYVVAVLLVGYLSMTRSFAYLGISQLKLFIGEVVLGTFLLARPRESLGRWVGALSSVSPLTATAWTLYVSLAYGAFQLIRGIILGYPLFTAVQNLVFNIYPFYLFLGLWVGLNHPRFLPRFARLFAWWNGIYGVVYIAVLSRLTWMFPDSMTSPGAELPVFSGTGGSAVALLALLAFEPNLARVWPLLVINVFVLFGLQMRAEWLGFVVGLVLLGCFGGQMGRMLKGAGIVIVLLTVGYVTDFSVPAPSMRGGEISTRGIIGRIAAPLDQNLAAKYTEHSETFADTASWRTTWWRAIWDSIHDDATTSFLGHGYGFQLSSLVPNIEDRPDVRTPHNVFYYALGYGGWVGVALFYSFQLCLARLLWLTRRKTSQPFGVAYLAMALVWATFDNFFETPFRAVPFYLLIGLAAAPALSPERMLARNLPASGNARWEWSGNQ